jgi:hypothetical protein
MLVGCGGGGDGPDRVPISGTVTFDGSPLPTGEIRFVPADGSGQAEATAIMDGKFSAEVTPGSKRVEITASREDPANMVESAVNPGQKEPTFVQYIPESYNATSTLTAEVKAEGENVLPPFELKSAGGDLPP